MSCRRIAASDTATAWQTCSCACPVIAAHTRLALRLAAIVCSAIHGRLSPVAAVRSERARALVHRLELAAARPTGRELPSAIPYRLALARAAFLPDLLGSRGSSPRQRPPTPSSCGRRFRADWPAAPSPWDETRVEQRLQSAGEMCRDTPDVCRKPPTE